MSNVFLKFNTVQINAYFRHVSEKSIETRSITVGLYVWIIFHSRKPRSCMEKTGFLHIVNFEREFFFKNTEVLKIIRNTKKSRDFEIA